MENKRIKRYEIVTSGLDKWYFFFFVKTINSSRKINIVFDPRCTFAFETRYIVCVIQKRYHDPL